MTRRGTASERSPRAARAGRGLLAALVGVLLVLAAVVVGAVPAAAQNAVGAWTPAVANTVGSPAGISAGQRLGNTSPQPQIVVATAVAAEGGEGFFARRLADMRANPDRGSVGGGTPRTNIAQNKQFNDAIKTAERQLGRRLSKDERSAVHREISGQDYGYHDIVDEVLGMFGGGG